MAQLSIPNDDELRQMMRALSQVIGIPLSQERIEIVLPEYKNLLERLENLNRVDIPLEVESDLIFDLTRALP